MSYQLRYTVFIQWNSMQPLKYNFEEFKAEEIMLILNIKHSICVCLLILYK